MSNASVMSAVKVDINEYEALRNSLNALETNYMVQSEKIDELSSLLGEKVYTFSTVIFSVNIYRSFAQLCYN